MKQHKGRRISGSDRLNKDLSVWSPLGPQYGTVGRAWFALMTEAEKVSDLHMEVKTALTGEHLEKIKNWQKDAYHKQMIGGFKETKEAEDGFRKAQKPWAKKLKEVQAQQLHTVSKHGLNTVRTLQGMCYSVFSLFVQ